MDIHIQIKTDSESFPDQDELDVRDYLEDALDAHADMSVVDVGSGLGVMDIIVDAKRTKSALKIIHQLIQELQIGDFTTVTPHKPERLPFQAKAGNLFCVPITDQYYVPGVVLHVSRYFKGCMLAAYFNKKISSPADVDLQHMPGEVIGTPNYTHVYPVAKGLWITIGNNRRLLTAIPIPELVVVADVFYKDKYIRKLPPSEISHYPILTVAGQGAVERNLRRYFGLKVPEQMEGTG